MVAAGLYLLFRIAICYPGQDALRKRRRLLAWLISDESWFQEPEHCNERVLFVIQDPGFTPQVRAFCKAQPCFFIFSDLNVSIQKYPNSSHRATHKKHVHTTKVTMGKQCGTHHG